MMAEYVTDILSEEELVCQTWAFREQFWPGFVRYLRRWVWRLIWCRLRGSPVPMSVPGSENLIGLSGIIYLFLNQSN